MLRLQSRSALAAACLASGLITAACASYAPAESSDLAGTRWAVRAIDGQPTQAQAVSVEFAAEDRIRGRSGCNTFTGVYEAAEGAIDVRALGSTEMACETSVMRQEQELLAVLDDAKTYTREDNRLIIVAEDGRALELAAL